MTASPTGQARGALADRISEALHRCEWTDGAFLDEAEWELILAALRTDAPAPSVEEVKDTIWTATLPFQRELETCGGVTFIGLRNAVAERVQALYAPHLAAEKAVAEERLRAGIQDYLDGNYEHPRRHRPGKCAHGTWYYDECPTCDEEHFQALLRATGSQGGQDVG